MPERSRGRQGGAGFEDAFRRQPSLGYAEVERHVRAEGGEPPIHLHHVGRMGILQRYAISNKTEAVEQLAVLQGGLEHGVQRPQSARLLGKGWGEARSPVPLGEG